MTSEFALNIVVYFRVFSDPSCREGRPCGSIFQRRENKGPGCLIGCGLNYPRSGLDWPESQLTSARCNFRGVTYLPTEKIYAVSCSLSKWQVFDSFLWKLIFQYFFPEYVHLLYFESVEEQENFILNNDKYVPQTISMYLVVITKLVPDTYIFWDRFDFFPLGKINVLIGMPIHATTHYQYQYKFLSSIHHCRKE